MASFDGLSVDIENLWQVSDAKTRSISAENFTGEKGKAGMATEGTGASCARDLGVGWKVSPSIRIEPQTTATLADIEGPGAIQHIWCTVHPKFWRQMVLRVYWDNEETPSIETPIGDFFCMGWCERANVHSAPIAVNPAGGFNSFWVMPFRKHARITVENLSKEATGGFYYQITYTLTPVPDDAAYFHAQFRRSNPLPYKTDHTLVDGIKGKGQYVGTYMAWQVNNSGWWGEGEIKFFMDGDKEFPTICGTGTEDYFCGAWDFEQPDGQYCIHCSPYSGVPQVTATDRLNRSQLRFGMYRWHIKDPIRFDKDLKVTMQALGWRSEGRYLPLQDDISSTVFWYQLEPHAPFPTLPDKDGLEVI